MKRKLFGLSLVALLAGAGAASADVLAEDSAANYTAETFVNGANEGSGFGAWEFWNAAPTLANSTDGVCGDINSENGVSFRFAQDGVEDHYGYCNGYRGFNALNPGDVLTFRFTCAYCGGNRGLDLFANGGHEESDKIANVINLSGDNEYSVNGSVIASNWAPHAVSEVTVSQLADGIQIAIKRTSTEEGVEDLEYSTKVETASKLTGIGLYAGGWEWNDGADVENYAFYVNDLKIEGTPPSDTLSLNGPWSAGASGDLEFTLSRQNSEGSLEVSISSSYPEFASVPESVTFADGETELKFNVAVTILGNENSSVIKAFADGVKEASYDVKGPKFTFSTYSNVLLKDSPAVDFYSDNLKVEWGAADESLAAIASTDEGVVTISLVDDWAEGERGSYSKWAVKPVDAGKASIELTYDGVKMCDYEFTVLAPSFSISGPASVKTGSVHDYTLSVVTKNASEPAVVSATGGASVDPASFDEVYPETPVTFSVTFPETAGTVILSAATPEGELAVEFPVTVTEPVDPSKFDDFVAYDDASLYDEGFNFDANGAGAEGFQAWGVYKTGAEYGGTFVGGDDGGFPAILTDGKTMAIYANGGASPDYAIFRPFVNDLQPGQKASVEFVVPEGSGTLYVQFARVWEGVPYSRFEAYVSDYNVGVNINGAAGDSKALGWSANPRRIVASVQRAADGSDYTLKLFGYNEGSEFPDDLYTHVVDSDVGEWYDGIQGIVIGAYNMGGGENMPFNKLAISQEEEPVTARSIDWAYGVWNPDAAGEYDFAISATTEDIGEVALSVEPSDGALSLSIDTVDLTGKTLAPFTVTLSSEAKEGDSFTITATPADTTVAQIEYNVTVSGTYVTLSCDNWEYPESAGEIWLALTASLSKYGTYTISTEDVGVLTVPDDSKSITVDSPDQKWFNVTIVGPGQAKIYATAEGATEPAAEFGFTITALPPAIDNTTMETVSFADGFSGTVTQEFAEKFHDVRAQVLQWNGEAKAFVEVEELNNEDEWPDMKFTPSIDNPVFRLIFVK